MKKKIISGFLLSCAVFMSSSILGSSQKDLADTAILKYYKLNCNPDEKATTSQALIDQIMALEEIPAKKRFSNLEQSIDHARKDSSHQDFLSHLKSVDGKIKENRQKKIAEWRQKKFYDVSATISKTAIVASAATLAIIYLSQNEWIASANPKTGYYSLLTLAKGPCLYSGKKIWQGLQLGITTLAKINQ